MRLIPTTIAALALLLAGCGTTTRPGELGVTRQQFLIVPAAAVERMALTHYADQAARARKEGKLVESGPELDRLRRISDRLVAHVGVFREDARQWGWSLTLIDAPALNATCAPDGKITFYTGLVRQLQLTDAEIAAVMGHEIAHALREHGREKVSESMGQQLLVSLAAARSSSPDATALMTQQVANVLYALPNSREKESEADRVGLELMARAGYDPAAALTLWQKMAAASKDKGAPQFLSTHPSHATRLAELQALQPAARRLYVQAAKP